MSAAINFEAELTQYIDTALWSESIGEEFAIAWADAHPAEATPASDVSFQSFGFDSESLEPEAREAMARDLHDFIDSCRPDALEFWARELGDGAIGHDFWLTRNRHGAGFWDRFGGDQEGERIGRELTKEAHPYGEAHLFANDDLETISYSS